MQRLIISALIGVMSLPAMADDDDDDKKFRFFETFKVLVANVQKNTLDIQALTAKIANIPTDTQSLAAQVQANTNAITTANSQIQTNTSGISANATQIQSNTTAIANLSNQVQTNTTSVGNLGNTVQTLQGDVNTLGGQVSANSTSLSGQNNQIQANALNIADNTSRITALENSSGTGGGTQGPTLISHTSYLSTVNTKEFSITGASPCNLVRHTFTRNVLPNGTQINVQEVHTDGAQNCSQINFEYLSDTSGLNLVVYNDLLNSINANFNESAPIISSSMEVGKSFGFAITSTSNPALGIVQKNTLIGVEDVAVTFGNFTACLKIHSDIKTTIGDNVDQVSWYCQNIGEVKRTLYNHNSNEIRVMQLTNIF